jgi:hypothetical protein
MISKCLVYHIMTKDTKGGAGLQLARLRIMKA